MFGARLAELRAKKGLSQYQVAQQLGFSRGQYANYEQGKREPDYAILSKLADYFNVPLDYLLGRTDIPTPYLNSVPQGTGKLKESDRDDLEKNQNLHLREVKEIPVFRLKPENREDFFAQDNIIGMEHVPADDMADFVIKIDDDSMSGSRINKGDRAIIRKQHEFVDGQTILVEIPDGTFMIRKAKNIENGIILSPGNQSFEPQYFKREELRIIGIVVQVIFDYI